MKKRYIFSLAALALLTAACSSDEMALNPADQPAPVEQKIPFTAVISADAAGTRALTEASDGKTITAKWEKEEKVALIHGEIIDVLEVSSVDATSGAATISGTITSPTDGESVFVVYVGHQHVNMSNYVSRLQEIYTSYKADNPESSAIPTSIISEPVNELLATQDGTLETISNKHDYRLATAKFAVKDNKATFASEVKMPASYAIWKLNLTTDGTTALKAKKLVMKKDGEANVTIDLGTDTSSEFYVAFIVSPSTYSFEATDSDDKTYSCTPTVSALDRGKYYRSTLTMAAAATGNTVDLSEKSADYTVANNDILTGTLNADYKVVIPDGYTITLNGATINYGGDDAPAITCQGSATIIIADGSSNSVTVPGDNTTSSPYPGILAAGTGTTLTFKGGTSGTGKLTVVGGNIAAGIGCKNGMGTGYTCGKIQIDGGVINAYSGNNTALGDGAEVGIGAVCGGPSGDLCEGITINGGTVTAKGGAAGIGGAGGTTCSFIKITGGTVNATGEEGAGIGTCSTGQCGDIIISGGKIYAKGGTSCAGIGTGCGVDLDHLSICASISISNGDVTAIGDEAGIGTGYAGQCGNITITGGTIVSVSSSTGTVDDNDGTGPGIGAGGGGKCGNISISGGTVTAKGGEQAAGIGSASGGSSSYESIIIADGITKVTATRGNGGDIPAEPIGRGVNDSTSEAAIFDGVTKDTTNSTDATWIYQ